jgi:glucose-1-phosphate thymidylyltransferase
MHFNVLSHQINFLSINQLIVDNERIVLLVKFGFSSLYICSNLNCFYRQGFRPLLERAAGNDTDATVFRYQVKDPERFGVVEFDENRQVVSIEEKPPSPKGNFAVTGLYFDDNQDIDIAVNVEPFHRGEVEITTINQEYLKLGKLKVELSRRGFACTIRALMTV